MRKEWTSLNSENPWERYVRFERHESAYAHAAPRQVPGRKNASRAILYRWKHRAGAIRVTTWTGDVSLRVFLVILACRCLLTSPVPWLHADEQRDRRENVSWRTVDVPSRTTTPTRTAGNMTRQRAGTTSAASVIPDLPAARPLRRYSVAHTAFLQEVAPSATGYRLIRLPCE